MAPASMTWHLATVCPESALWRTLLDSGRWLQSLCRLTPLQTCVRGPSHLRKRMLRNYDNGDRTSRRLHRRSRYSTLRPMRMARRVPPGVVPVRSNTTS